MGLNLQVSWPPNLALTSAAPTCGTVPLDPSSQALKVEIGWKVMGWNYTSPGSQASSGARRTFPWAPSSEPDALQAKRAWNQGRGLDSFRKSGTCREVPGTNPSSGKGTWCTKHLPTRGQTMGAIRGWSQACRAREPFAQLGPSPMDPKSV